MPLRILIKSLDQAPRLIREYYIRDEHGYRLDLSDLDTFVGGLKTALQRERELNKQIKAAGVTPDGLGALSSLRGKQSAPDVRAGLLPRRRRHSPLYE